MSVDCKDEIYENDWCRMAKDSDDDKVIECYTQIITAVVDSEDNESTKYAADAPDSWLCAHA